MNRILIIDDDELIRKAFKCVLEKFDYKLDFACTAKEAENLITLNKYDLVFLDLALPDKDGKELLKDIRSSNKDVKICIMSAFLSKLGNLLEDHGQTTSNISFCMKPISREEMIKITEEALSTK